MLRILGIFLTLLFGATMSAEETKKLESITLGGGCFWCIEAVYQRMPGVQSVLSGYAGGKTENPTYDAVCSGQTGHAEVVQVTFHPSLVSLPEILDLFWRAHDPTTLNRQGNDIGTQYRSVIFFPDPAQKTIIEASKERAQAELSDPIVTEVASLPKFYPAEDYHQNYYNRNKNQGYCTFVIRPKLEKLQKTGDLP